MFRTISALASAAAALLLSGCIAVGTIDRRAITVNQEVGSTQNQFVLLNLARASREEPVYFVAFNQLGASGTTDFRAGAPQFFIGPNLPAADRIATFTGGATFLDNQTNTNFQMSLLGSKDFYSGLLAPLGLRDVDLLLHQGYSRELIFYLVIEKAKITLVPPDGRPSAFPPQVVYNDPSDAKNFQLFQYYIKEAMEHGLTTETFQTPDGAADDGSSDSSPGEKGWKARPPKLQTQAELCYDKALALPSDIPDIASGSFCGDKPDVRPATQGPSEPLYVTLHDKSFALHDQRLEIEVTTRSIYGIYYYLGRIIRSGRTVDLQAFDLPAEKLLAAPLVDVAVDRPPEGEQDAGCFTAVRYEGQRFCVPREGADNTKHIFGILNALIALKQSNADIPVTQSVRIQQ
ncbi:MAG TPA: hypothetical protein VMT68_14570 [Caulobacteraceae bacterium]|nr:hypothetical protein [Caulobacteraceae bacterium]